MNVCVSLLDLVVTLAKSYLVLLFSVEDFHLSLFSFMTVPFESLLLMLIHDVFSLSIPTYLHFSWVGKPILDKSHLPSKLTLSSEIR